MTVAVVVVCPAEIRDDAVQWANAGLIADSFWVSSADAGSVDPDRPNSLEAWRMAPGHKRAAEPLVKSLADLGALNEVRVAWIRPSEQQFSGSLKTLEGLLREMLPPDATRWLDVVVPTKRTDRTMVPLPGQWLQLCVRPEDRSAPDVMDAGWDLDLDVPLHGALAAAGILGGTFGQLPWWGKTDAAHRYDFRAFSRIVLGAENADVEAHRFIAQTMPVSSAGRFFPERYLELDHEASVSLVNDAIKNLLGLESDALSYRDPATSKFAEPPNLSVREHIVLMARFLGYSLPLLAGSRRAATTTAHSRFNFTDLGHKVGDDVRIATRSLKPADFDALDAQAAEQARKDLDIFERDLRRNTPVPPANAWRVLLRLATSINDGGQAPDGWDPPKQHDRRPVVTAQWVQPGTVGPVSSEVPEIAAARGVAVAVAVATDARRARSPSLAVLGDSSGAVETAKALANEGNTRDRDRLAEQLGELDAPSGCEPTNFLDRLSARVIGGGLRARLDAERWSEFATGPTLNDPVNWNAAQRKFRMRTLVGLGATAGLSGVWGLAAYFLRGQLPAWLSMPLGVGVVGVAGSGFLLWTLYSFFKIYNAFMERGRRRLEMRAIWLRRACDALEEAARLSPARRILAKWVDILGAIFPFDDSAGRPPDRVMPLKAPKCMTVAVPVYGEREMTKWLAEEGAEVGWRMRALECMAASAFEMPPADAVKRLVEDNGLAGGPLVDFWERRDSLWDDHAEALRRESSSDVAARMVNSESSTVSIVTQHARRGSEGPLKLFEDEPWPRREDDDAAEWDQTLDFPVRASRSGSEHAVASNPDTCLISVRLQLRRTAQWANDDEADRDTVDDSCDSGDFG